MTANSQAVPADGLASMSYDAASNRIITAGGQQSASLRRFEESNSREVAQKIKPDSGNFYDLDGTTAGGSLPWQRYLTAPDANMPLTDTNMQLTESGDLGAYGTDHTTTAGDDASALAQSPIGSFDGVESTGFAWGWSLDPDNANSSIAIHFYIDGPAGTGTYIGQVVANTARPDVNSVTGYPGDHGFGYQIPIQYLNGQTHSLYAYGIDTGGDANTLLGGSPKTFTITSPNAFTYDLAGNLKRGQKPDGTWQKFTYDAAGRLTQVLNDGDNWVQQVNGYGATNQRVHSWSYAGALVTWYAWAGDSVIAEYTGGWDASAPLNWQKSYIYAGSRLLMTAANNGAGGEALEFHHPDRLGTRLVTNNAANTSFEQSTLPFGTAMPSESTGFSNQVFTSYDRSPIAGLDYAVNRTYSPGQSRFTQVDPIGLASANLADPQTNNLYAYTRNSPTDFVDPSGLLLDLGCTYLGSYTYGDFRYEVNICFYDNGSTGGGGAGYGIGHKVSPPDDVPPRSGPCDLQVAAFDQLAQQNPAALAILERSFKGARLQYQVWDPYTRAVFLNTVAAVASQGVNLDSAKFQGFIRGGAGGEANGNAYGVYLSGISTRNLDDAGLVEKSIANLGTSRRSPGDIKEGSVEATVSGSDVGFDVDLNNPFGGLGAFLKHLEEVDFNKKNNTTTHPADVVRKLNARGISTGVTCK